MSKKNGGFFSRMRKSDKPGFEISMFSISVALSLFMLVAIVLVGWYYIKGQAGHYTDEEVNAGSVTQSAVEVDNKEEEPVPTVDPNSDVIINEDNVFDGDEELKTAEFAYTTSDVNMRSDASLTSAVIAKVPFGAEVKMISYDGKEWAKVSYKDQEGYINAMYLSVTKPVPIIDAPVVTKTPKPTKTPKETPAPDETEEPDYPEDPTEEPAAPTEKPAEPTEKPAEPTEKPAEPTEKPEEPTAEPETPPAE